MLVQQRSGRCPLTVLLALVLAWVVNTQPASAQVYGKITGKIVRKDAGAAPLAQVTVRVDSTSLEAQTDSTGWYVIDHVPTGQHKLTAQRDGFLPTIVHTFEVLAKTIRVDIALEDPSSRPLGWNDSTATFGIIGGYVRSKRTKQPLPFAVVCIDDTNMGAQANPNGVYQIRRVPPGTYSVGGFLNGWMSERIRNIVVHSGATTQVTFFLEEGVVETEGRIVVGNREPLTFTQ